jgi:formylglycine-generating enzyme required for sulfatase activity
MADGKNAGPIVTWDKSSSNYSVSGASKPIGYVDWRDAARFCNWLTTGDTENGVYNFSAPGIGVMDHLAAAEAFGTAFFLPTEDEWYKAAYHKNNGVSGDYWVYPTGSDQEPADVGSDAFSTGYANYHTGDSDLVAVDAAGSASPYGTIGQGGNVYEWTESVFLGENDRIYRGGSSINLNTTQMESRNRQNNSRTFARWDIGFRIGAIGPDLGFEPGGNDPIVPEPATVTLYGLGLAGLVTVRVARSRGRS